MKEFLKSISFTTKFSVIAFMMTATLGLLSMGILGAGLYYPVSFLFTAYPTLNEWNGDWVWTVVISVGILWSVGFLLGGLAWHYLKKHISSKALLRIIYVLILWLWAAIIWYGMIQSNVEPL